MVKSGVLCIANQDSIERGRISSTVGLIYLPAPFMNLLVFFVVNKECLFLMQHFCIFP